METQIKALKINSQNIKSTLINRNKELKKLRLQENNLFNQQQSERQKEQRESSLESQKSGGVLGGIGARLLAGPMSLFDKIKEFFGNILLGILVNNLPRIYAGIQKFLDDNKNIIETIKTVLKVTGNAIMGFIDVFNATKDIAGQIGNTINQIKSGLDELSEFASNIVNETSILNTDILSLDKDFKDEFKDEYTARTTQQVREDVKTEIKQSGVTKKQFSQSLNQYRTVKNQSEPTQKVSIPGVGSYQRVKKGFWEGGMFGGTKEVTTDAFGSSISPQEFDTRFLGVAGDVDNLFQGYSEGGTVKPTTSGSALKGQSFSGESGTARKARESTQSFSTFENNAIAQSNIIGVQEENNKNFEEMIKKFKELFGKKDEGIVSSPYAPPTSDPRQQAPVIPSPSGLPAIDVNPKDVIGTVGYTGYTEPKGPGGSHIHIQNMDNYENGVPQGVKYSILVNGVPMPQKLKFTSGIGMRWGKMHKGEDFAGDPNQQITLTGGLKFVQYIPDQGDGYGNRVIIQAPSGVKYSLNHLNSGPLNINELIERQKNSAKDPVKEQAGNLLKALERPGEVPEVKVDPNNLQKLKIAPKLKNRGKGGLDKLSQTFDDGDGSVVMIMAQQPVIVPGPTRYITRTIAQPMPFPVVMHPKSSGLRGLV